MAERYFAFCSVLFFLGLILILSTKEGSARSHNDRGRGEKSAGILAPALGLIVKIALTTSRADFCTSYIPKILKSYVEAEI